MPVAVRITPRQMSKDDYNRAIKELEDSGVGEPEGRSFHAAYGEDNVHVFEVWDSQEQIEEHRERTFPILQGAGFDAGAVEIHPLQSDLPD